MKKLLFVFFFVLLSLSANSRDTEWAIAGYSKNNTISHYTDWSSLKADGDSVYYWELVDFRFLNTPNEDGRTGSYVTYHEGDCVKFRYRSFQTHWYDNFMAKGDIVNTTTPSNEWKYPPPDTPQNRSLHSACILTDHLRDEY